MRFWIHQAMEYLLAGFLISETLHSRRPLVIGLAGIAILLLAASGDGPMRAIGHLSRPAHRTVDLVAVVGLFAAALVFRSSLDVVGFVELLGAAGALVVLVGATDYRPRVRRPPGRFRPGRAIDSLTAPPRGSLSSEDVGRRAGRLVGNGVRAWRQRRGQSHDE